MGSPLRCTSRYPLRYEDAGDAKGTGLNPVPNWGHTFRGRCLCRVVAVASVALLTAACVEIYLFIYLHAHYFGFFH